jgi:lipopolysaccharide/colanic/teichoic acid biosynthesis glycosyltransferase
MEYKKIKRLLDIVFSLLLLLISVPILLFFVIFISIFMGLPVFFIQKRVGKDNAVFKLYKFRSMRDKSDKYDVDYKRITAFGRILRIARIDELPQLVNILKGDMSFIGPRPLLPEYLPYYSEYELQRHNVRPGLSGLSQVSGSYPSWEEQFEYDIKYVNGLTLKMDVIVLIKTFKKVLFPTRKLISGKQGRVRFDVYRSLLVN